MLARARKIEDLEILLKKWGGLKDQFEIIFAILFFLLAIYTAKSFSSLRRTCTEKCALMKFFGARSIHLSLQFYPKN